MSSTGAYSCGSQRGQSLASVISKQTFNIVPIIHIIMGCPCPSWSVFFLVDPLCLPLLLKPNGCRKSQRGWKLAVSWKPNTLSGKTTYFSFKKQFCRFLSPPAGGQNCFWGYFSIMGNQTHNCFGSTGLISESRRGKKVSLEKSKWSRSNPPPPVPAIYRLYRSLTLTNLTCRV